MNMKNEFANWFEPKSPEGYKSWFGKNLNTKLNDINNAYMASFKKSLFDIDMENISMEISSIINNIKNRLVVEDKTFAEYDKKSSNGIPKAIINKYYVRFLENYGESMPGDDPTVNYFTYEDDLQNSLISQAEDLFPDYKIYGNNGEGIQYSIGGKRIDLLLEHKTNNQLLVLELKAGIADFKVFGQISMYLGLLMEKFPDKIINGKIIAGEIDNSLIKATLTNKNVKLMEYKMELRLNEIGGD